MINKKRKPTPVKASAKATEETQSEITQTEPAREEKITAPVEVPPAPTPVMNVEPPLISQPSSKPKPPTMASLKGEVD